MKLSLSNWYPGSGVVLNCIYSLSLPSFFLRKYKYVQFHLHSHYNMDKVSFLNSLEPSHGVLQLFKNFYSVLILHLLKPFFSVFRVFQALSIFLF